MKTIALLVALFFGTASNQLFATSTDHESKPRTAAGVKETVTKQLHRFLVDPSARAHSLTGEIDVDLRVTEDGQLEIVHMRSDNAELARFVSRQLHKIDLKGDYSGRQDVLKFRFIYGKQA